VKTCPVCAREFPDNVKFCPNDGQTLRSKGPMADLIGQVVADRYHIIKKLGEGGMGAVYLGEHVKMGRKSAIKVMTQAMSNDPDAVSRFNREASNASRLSHPNICQIYDFGETTDGVIYLAMEFIEGCSLSDLIDREGALPPARAASILKQSAEALQVAHDQTIVHRDIKPDNIMIVTAKDGSDVAKVVDFGIAKAVAGDETGQKVTKTGLVVGTPEYMSPEQLSGDKLDGRSDIYSLGLVLYKMLTGVLPFQADTAQETMIKRLTDNPEPLAQARPDIVFPASLQAVLDHALARSVDDRYASAAEFGRDVMASVGDAGVPGTRMDVAHVTQAATQLMNTELALKLAKKEKGAAAPAPTPTKKFPLVPVLGGVGTVGVLAVVAVLMMNKGAAPAPAGDAGTPATQGAPAGGQTPPGNPGGTPPANVPTGNQMAPAGPGAQPGTRQTTPGRTNVAANTPNTTTPSGGVTAAIVEDSAGAATRADQDGRSAEARRLARWVYLQPAATNQQKADMAELVATTYENDQAQALQWLQNAYRYAIGNQRSRLATAIQAYGGTP
jgi:eukaryotic-like serine/threonine-protein kinase